MNQNWYRSGNARPLIIVAGVVFVLIIFVLTVTFRIVTVEGNELGVKETWSGGVEPEPLKPKTYFLFPGWTQKIYKYSMGPQVFVMNNVTSENERIADGRELDAYRVESSEGQSMEISLNVRWRINQEKVVWFHQNIRDNIEEKLLRPVVMRIVKDAATRRKAVEAYSGEGLVLLQQEIQAKLTDPEGELSESGLIVENFVIEGISLDPQYIGEIKARQVATQRQQRAVEETKAAEAEALRAQAEAKSDMNKRVVEAERDKMVAVLVAEQTAEAQVLAAEANAKQVALAAEADANKVRLAAEADGAKVRISAEAERAAAEEKSVAIRLLGEAEAEAQKLRLSAYAVPGAEAFVQIEVAKSAAFAFQNIQGYLPSDMTVNLLSENFTKSVQALMARPTAPQPRE